MEQTYHVPFESFERYSPYGRPGDVAEFVASYLEAGCATFSFVPVAAEPEAAIEGLAEVKRLLSG